MRRKAKPLVLFAGLPTVLRQLRGTRPVREVAAAVGLAKEHMVLLEERLPRQFGKRVLQRRPGKTPRLDTLDGLLRFYGVSLSQLEALLKAVQEGGDPSSGSEPS